MCMCAISLMTLCDKAAWGVEISVFRRKLHLQPLCGMLRSILKPHINQYICVCVCVCPHISMEWTFPSSDWIVLTTGSLSHDG